MDRLSIVLVALATASPAAAQQPQRVFTNVVNSRPQREIVSVWREVQRALPVPDSIVTTQTPLKWRPEIVGIGYVPPVRSNWGETRVSRPTPVVQPMFINGIFAGPSPSGNWMSTSIGRPIVDVRIINDPTHGGRRTR